MFDSSKRPKAEALLVSTTTTLAKREKKKKVFRSISEWKTRSSSLPRSYPHVFPSKYPTSEINVAHAYTVRMCSASPPGRGLARTDRGGAPLLRRLAPVSRIPARTGASLPAALPLRNTGGPSVTAARSVCVNPAGGSALSPSLPQISHSWFTPTSRLKWGRGHTWPSRAELTPGLSSSPRAPRASSLRIWISTFTRNLLTSLWGHLTSAFTRAVLYSKDSRPPSFLLRLYKGVHIP